MLRPLPRTDEAFADESVLGYALRMAEANRVGGLAGTARLLGCGSIVRGGASHAAALGQLYGASPSRLTLLAPQPIRRNGELHMSLMGCEFSRPWLLRSQRPQICPKCLAEHGYARVDWDILFMTHCRIHGNGLLDQCPDCKDTLHWRRKTLRRCACGKDLTAIDVALPIASASKDFAAWLGGRLGLPVGGMSAVDACDWEQALEGLTVDGALLLLWALGVRRSAHDNIDPGRTHGPIQTFEVDAIVRRAYERLRAIRAGTAWSNGDGLAIHVSALASLAARGLTDGDRRAAAQLLATLGLRTWKNARMRDRSSQSQLELFELDPR